MKKLGFATAATFLVLWLTPGLLNAQTTYTITSFGPTPTAIVVPSNGTVYFTAAISPEAGAGGVTISVYDSAQFFATGITIDAGDSSGTSAPLSIPGCNSSSVCVTSLIDDDVTAAVVGQTTGQAYAGLALDPNYPSIHFDTLSQPPTIESGHTVPAVVSLLAPAPSGGLEVALGLAGSGESLLTFSEGPVLITGQSANITATAATGLTQDYTAIVTPVLNLAGATQFVDGTSVNVTLAP